MNQQEMHTAAREMLADPDEAARFLGSLPMDILNDVYFLLKQVREARVGASLVGKVRAKLTNLGIADQVRAIVFSADEWDNGWFLSVHGVTHLRDGRIYGGPGDIEFDVYAELSKLGRVYPGFCLVLYPEGAFDEDSVQVITADGRADLREKLADIRKEQG